MKDRHFRVVVILFITVIVCSTVYKPKSNKQIDEIEIVTDTLHPSKIIALQRGTTYYTDSSQCSGSPNHTADGSIINNDALYNKKISWVALSRDLIYCEERQKLYKDTTHWRGEFKFGDTIVVSSKEFPHLNGDWVVHDCMSPKYKLSIDFLVHPVNNKPKLGVATDIKIKKKKKK